MKPFIHAKNSAKKYGGVPEDYQKIHDFLDHSKVSVADMRHRAMLHSSWGIYLVEQVFGPTFKNSEGRTLSTRDIAEDHVIEDIGHIPTMQDYLDNMTLQPWMGGAKRKRSFHAFTQDPKKALVD